MPVLPSSCGPYAVAPPSWTLQVDACQRFSQAQASMSHLQYFSTPLKATSSCTFFRLVIRARTDGKYSLSQGLRTRAMHPLRFRQPCGRHRVNTKISKFVPAASLLHTTAKLQHNESPAWQSITHMLHNVLPHEQHAECVSAKPVFPVATVISKLRGVKGVLVTKRTSQRH